jgi:hypothetical protein
VSQPDKHEKIHGVLGAGAARLFRSFWGAADMSNYEKALADAERSFEFIRLKLVDCLDEPERSAFWRAVEARDALRGLEIARGLLPDLQKCNCMMCLAEGENSPHYRRVSFAHPSQTRPMREGDV